MSFFVLQLFLRLYDTAFYQDVHPSCEKKKKILSIQIVFPEIERAKERNFPHRRRESSLFQPASSRNNEKGYISEFYLLRTMILKIAFPALLSFRLAILFPLFSLSLSYSLIYMFCDSIDSMYCACDMLFFSQPPTLLHVRFHLFMFFFFLLSPSISSPTQKLWMYKEKRCKAKDKDFFPRNAEAKIYIFSSLTPSDGKKFT